MGPFETEYKTYWPKLDDEDAATVKQYPDHRDFVFEQLLKIKLNIGEYQLSQNPDYNPNAPITKTSPFFFLSMAIAAMAMLFMIFVR